MATSQFREDFLGRNLTTPTSNSMDSLGRATTSTTDFMGRSLRRVVRANSTAVTLNQELQFVGGEKVHGHCRGYDGGVCSVGAGGGCDCG